GAMKEAKVRTMMVDDGVGGRWEKARGDGGEGEESRKRGVVGEEKEKHIEFL
ncbi:hypothetical protein B296_00046232, partial [Ensete ventricosum]